MNRYEYEGPVMEFDRCVADRWSGTTYALSVKKAKCNLAYQYKKANNKCANTRISLPGEVVMVQ